MAKFGIALGSGPRGLGFESRHSDQKRQHSICYAVFFMLRWRNSNNLNATVRTRLQRLVSRLGESLGRLFGKLQSIAMGRGTVLDYVRPEAQAVVDDLNELDNEEYEL